MGAIPTIDPLSANADMSPKKVASPCTDTLPDADTVQKPLPSAVGAAATVAEPFTRFDRSDGTWAPEWLTTEAAWAGLPTTMVVTDRTSINATTHFRPVMCFMQA